MKSLFITYNSALEPLIQSQGIPYLKGLSKNKVKSVLLSFEKKPKDKQLFNEKINSLKEKLLKENIKLYNLRYHKWPTLPATCFDILVGTIVGLYIAIVEKVDIIHARSTVPALMAWIITRITGKKFVFDERGLMAEEYVDGGMWKKGGFIYKITYAVERRLLLDADHVVVLSDNIKQFLLNTDYLAKEENQRQKQITVIPCCVDKERFKKEIASPLARNDNIEKSIIARSTEGATRQSNLFDKFTFLYIGSLGTWYLMKEMLDFFVEAKKAIPNAHFLILTHTSKQFVQELCNKKGLSEEDITVDSVSFDEIPYYVKMSDVGLFFIKPCFSKKSSCPTKFAEYLVCGLPVVINRGIGDTDNIVNDYRVGVVIDNFNEQGYKSAVNKLLDLLKDKEEIKNKCSKAINEIFKLDIGVGKYFNVYNQTLKGRSINQ